MPFEENSYEQKHGKDSNVQIHFMSDPFEKSWHVLHILFRDNLPYKNANIIISVKLYLSSQGWRGQ